MAAVVSVIVSKLPTAAPVTAQNHPSAVGRIADHSFHTINNATPR